MSAQHKQPTIVQNAVENIKKITNCLRITNFYCNFVGNLYRIALLCPRVYKKMYNNHDTSNQRHIQRFG